jgi:dTDP-4-dehydrorhamnose reductase
MRVLMFGAGGMLGRDLVATVPGDVELVWGEGRRVDLTDTAAVCAAIDATNPAYIVNAAGYTDVERAEDEPDAAEAVNGAAVSRLAAACAAHDTTLVHFSTDYVFPGHATRAWREEDRCEPVSAYARSKRSGELGIAASGARALVIRTQWLFGLHGRSFPRTMWERATERMPTRVVNDQWGRPTYSRDLAAWTWRLVGAGTLGTVHAANGGEATWFDVARPVFAQAGATELLSPCSTAEFPTRAARPRYSVLDTSLLTRLLGEEPRPWDVALAEFLEADLRHGRG